MDCKLEQSMKILISLVPLMNDNEYEECGIEIVDCIDKLDTIYLENFSNELGVSPTTASI